MDPNHGYDCRRVVPTSDGRGAARLRTNGADADVARDGRGDGDRQHTDHDGNGEHSHEYDSDGDDADHDSHRADPLGRPKGSAGRMPLPR